MIRDIDPILADWKHAVVAIRKVRDTFLTTPGVADYATQFERIAARFIAEENGVLEYLRRAQRGGEDR